MVRVLAFLTLLFFGSIADSFALDRALPWPEWQEARTLYEAGKYEEAFQALSSKPKVDDPIYFYDLGTIAYRQGKAGAALGYFEKASHLKRHDPDIRHNLELARSDLIRALGPDRLDPSSSWSENLADQLSLEELRGVLGLMALLLVLFWIRTYWRSRNIKKTLLRPAGIIGLAALLFIISLYGLETLAHSHSPAIALSRQTIRSGPGEGFIELSQAEAGMKVRLLGPSAENWLQVRYSQEGVGWVQAAGFLVID